MTPLQETMKRQPTFKVMVEERGPFDELLATLDLKHYSPVPGGLYAPEIQRLISNPVDHPLAQPYAAFSGPELLTIAVENLIASPSAAEWSTPFRTRNAREPKRLHARKSLRRSPGTAQRCRIAD